MARNPINVARAYTPDTVWRNRDTFLQGTKEVEDFLTRKWDKEKNYRFGTPFAQRLTAFLTSGLDYVRSCLLSRTTRSQCSFGTSKSRPDIPNLAIRLLLSLELGQDLQLSAPQADAWPDTGIRMMA